MNALPKEPLRPLEFQTITAQMNAILGTSGKIIVEPTVIGKANDPTPAKTNRFATWIYRMTEANYTAWERSGGIKGSL